MTGLLPSRAPAVTLRRSQICPFGAVSGPGCRYISACGALDLGGGACVRCACGGHVGSVVHKRVSVSPPDAIWAFPQDEALKSSDLRPLQGSRARDYEDSRALYPWTAFINPLLPNTRFGRKRPPAEAADWPRLAATMARGFAHGRVTHSSGRCTVIAQ